ncbi:hypothetical protein DFP72DRAFT_1139404 [Ephemerocybe angulata]|uniref:F-box domain-containing protein n=1 Tax=Ephemerocybe angulata TaxID=980116 RepID=A0A8H6HP30_9AGAR|nr:hypothetical protein DFP72DRAFT_1139404 [Tulosesus angulatus]
MPPRKMAKSSASTNAPSVSTEAKKGRKKRNLKTITTLPAELISLIMQDLDPKTTLNVARTNKFFRNTLVPMKALWLAKLKEIGAPEPPRGVPEHVWLRMLATTNCLMRKAECQNRHTHSTQNMSGVHAFKLQPVDYPVTPLSSAIIDSQD